MHHWWQCSQLIILWEVARTFPSSYATFIEAGMVATDSTQHHSTYNRTCFLEILQGVRITSNYPVNKDCYCLSTMNNKLEPRSVNLHCNLATQVQCSNARVKSSRMTEITNKQRLNQVKQLEPCFKCLQLFLKSKSSSNNYRITTSNNLPAMQGAYQLQSLTLIVIEGQVKNYTCLQQLLFMFRNLTEHQLSLPHVTHNTLLLRRTTVWSTI